VADFYFNLKTFILLIKGYGGEVNKEVLNTITHKTPTVLKCILHVKDKKIHMKGSEVKYTHSSLPFSGPVTSINFHKLPTFTKTYLLANCVHMHIYTVFIYLHQRNLIFSITKHTDLPHSV
jgi:hypothetical protein